MSTAILCGLIILITLIIMLIAGVPIAVALGVSSVCAILPNSSGQHYEQGRHRHPYYQSR